MSFFLQRQLKDLTDNSADDRSLFFDFCVGNISVWFLVVSLWLSLPSSFSLFGRISKSIFSSFFLVDIFIHERWSPWRNFFSHLRSWSSWNLLLSHWTSMYCMYIDKASKRGKISYNLLVLRGWLSRNSFLYWIKEEIIEIMCKYQWTRLFWRIGSDKTSCIELLCPRELDDSI